MSHSTPLLGYPDGIYQYIYNTALIVHPTHIFNAFHYRMPECGILGLTLYGASLNYWRYPKMKSWRRTFDMIIAKTTIAYHFYLSLSTPNKWITTVPITVGGSLYYVSIFLSNRGNIKTAALCHALIHILVSLGASFTYRDYLRT